MSLTIQEIGNELCPCWFAAKTVSLSIRFENCVDADSGIGNENYVAVDSGIGSDSGVDFWHSF